MLAVALTGSYTNQLYAYIPGDVPFTPEEDDAVQLTRPDGSKYITHIAFINVTQPDGTPVVYEIGFK